LADNTKPGSKDITDLKARLGLKKQAAGGPGVPAPGPGPAAPFAPAGIPGPPGVAAQKPVGPGAMQGGVPAPAGVVPPMGAIPPPPGFAAPPEAASAQPDPRRDPYAAQQAAMAASLAAFYTAGNALPGDASNVEGAKKGPPVAIIAGVAVAAVVAGGLGYFVGSIKVARDQYAEATEQAGQIKKEVQDIKKQVAEAVSTFKEVKPGEPPSAATLDKLEKLDLKEPDATQKLFHTNYATFEPRLVRSMFEYYQSVTKLFQQINEHAAKTKNDKEDLDKCFGAAKQPPKAGAIGVVFDYSQKLPYAQVVALGGVVCPGGDPNKVDCAEAEMKLRYRSSLSGGFSERPVKGLPKDIVMAIQPSELQKQLIAGDPSQLACRDYSRRAAAILQTLSKLPEEEKALIEGLEKRIKAPPV
jgi:hypothetical protein